VTSLHRRAQDDVVLVALFPRRRRAQRVNRVGVPRARDGSRLCSRLRYVRRRVAATVLLLCFI